MARTKDKARKNGTPKEKTKDAASTSSPEQLYASAVDLLEQSQPEEALTVAKQLWAQVHTLPPTEKLGAANLLGEISIELGAIDSAREYFEQAVQFDPEGKVPEALGGGAEKFLWLAQLSTEGGKDSVGWFEKGAKALQYEIDALENGHIKGLSDEELLMLRVEKKRKLANALCAVVEIYMTDLSWEEDAESRCEQLITEAMAVEGETSPEVLQTLASVRLSQQRQEDAQSALKRSLAIWIDLDPEDAAVPDFATKVSLSRLLMEAEMEREALEVLHRLVQEDDQSVEAWYLGGWCRHLLAERNQALTGTKDETAMDVGNGDSSLSTSEQHIGALRSSRKWLKTSLKLYKELNYEDQRLFDHAQELVQSLDTVLGPEDEQAEGGDEDESEWEGIHDEEDRDGDDDDEEMQDA